MILLDEVDEWFLDLARRDPETADRVAAAIDVLAERGPALGRPLADRIKGSSLHHLKELRPPSTSVRVLFAFDPERQAVLLIGGDKAGQWTGWYTKAIPVAEERYARWLADSDRKE